MDAAFIASMAINSRSVSVTWLKLAARVQNQPGTGTLKLMMFRQVSSEPGFQPLFKGVDLTGWEGDPNVWSWKGRHAGLRGATCWVRQPGRSARPTRTSRSASSFACRSGPRPVGRKRQLLFLHRGSLGPWVRRAREGPGCPLFLPNPPAEGPPARRSTIWLRRLLHGGRRRQDTDARQARGRR